MYPFSTNDKILTISVFSAISLLAACGGGEPATSSASSQMAAEPSGTYPLAEDHLAPANGSSSPDSIGGHLAPADGHAAQPQQTEERDTTPASGETQLLANAIASPPLAVPESIVLAPGYTSLIPATINTKSYWPLWTPTRRPVDGVNCFIKANFHNHTLISIYKDGVRLGFPNQIGLAGCPHAYELHVHDGTGIIHIETDAPKNFKLGNWFTLWRQSLTVDNVAGLVGPARFYVIDKEKISPYIGNPSDIAMLPHREILIVTGTRLSVVPRYKW